MAETKTDDKAKAADKDTETKTDDKAKASAKAPADPTHKDLLQRATTLVASRYLSKAWVNARLMSKDPNDYSQEELDACATELDNFQEAIAAQKKAKK